MAGAAPDPPVRPWAGPCRSPNRVSYFDVGTGTRHGRIRWSNKLLAVAMHTIEVLLGAPPQSSMIVAKLRAGLWILRRLVPERRHWPEAGTPLVENARRPHPSGWGRCRWQG